ncbi:unnamed protein product [Clavelina lepadiformis]|uniref:Cytochrome P450 n=1 Tax=Clavelina lepadiformis TaxID=159417 RepID=A0ABP0GPG5_CLALP
MYSWYSKCSRVNSPPGPWGIPLLGILPFLGKYPERTLRKYSETYGPIISVRMATMDTVVLNDYDSIYQALVKQASKFSGRPSFSWSHDIIKGHGLAVLDYGPFLKSQRKFGLSTLRGFGMGKKSMEERVIEETAYFNDRISSQNGKAFDISDILRIAVANNICSVIFGTRFSYDDVRLTEFINIVLMLFTDQVTTIAVQVLTFAPQLVYVPPFSGVHRRFAESVSLVNDMIQKIVDEHKETFDEENPRDFIDAFLKEMKPENDHFSNEQLLFYVRDLFIGGTETTSTTLRWAILCLIHYPQTQKQIREEIHEVIGSSGTVHMSHKPDMHYTNAFIQELMRYRTLGPLGIFHKTNEEADLNGYTIPKDVMIVPNLWAVHNDPNVWEEPGQFRPERFLDADGKFVASNQVIPFSLGSRRCMGEQLAKTEIFIFLVSMVQKFEFLPDPEADKLPEINDGTNGLAFSPYPYRIVAKEL